MRERYYDKRLSIYYFHSFQLRLDNILLIYKIMWVG